MSTKRDDDENLGISLQGDPRREIGASSSAGTVEEGRAAARSRDESEELVFTVADEHGEPSPQPSAWRPRWLSRRLVPPLLLSGFSSSGAAPSSPQLANPFRLASPRLAAGDAPDAMPALDLDSADIEGKGTPFSATVNLLATAMGAGLLSLPRAFALTGAGLGVALMLAIGWGADLSLQFLVVLSRSSRRRSYAGNAQHYLGIWGKRVTNSLLVLLLFMAAVAMTIIVMQLFSKFLQEEVSAPDDWWSSQTVVAIASLAFIYPVCLMEQITVLRYTSAVALCNLAYYFTCLNLRFWGREGGPKIHPSVVFVNDDVFEIFLGISVMVAAYICQFNIFQIDAELKREHKQRIWSVIHVAIPGIATSLYITGGLLGYFFFGSSVSNNMLNQFPNDTLMVVARAAISFTNVFKMPLIIQPLRSTLCESFEGLARFRISFTAALLLAVLAVASSLASLSKALGVLGCTAGMAIAFILPGLMRSRHSRMRVSFSNQAVDHINGPEPRWEQAGSWALFVIGSITSLGAFVSTIYDWNLA